MSNQSLREAAQQALEAWDVYLETGFDSGVEASMFKLQEALAQPDDNDLGLMASLQDILDGTDTGEGVSPEPWEGLRRRVLKLMRPDDKAQPVAWHATFTNAAGKPDVYVTTHRELAVENDNRGLPRPLVFGDAAPQSPAEQNAELSGYPPLPEPDGYITLTEAGSVIVPPREFEKHNAYAVFTAEQVRQAQRDAIAADRAARGGA